jgi:hypothetical protein
VPWLLPGLVLRLQRELKPVLGAGSVLPLAAPHDKPVAHQEVAEITRMLSPAYLKTFNGGSICLVNSL